MKYLTLTLLLAFSLVASAGPIRILDGQQISNQGAILLLPTTATTLVGTDTTDTLTNKTIDASVNTITNVTADNVSGTVAIANGGTGATTAQAAANALLPDQSSANGQYLTSDGTNTSWAAIPAVMPMISGTRAAPVAVVAGTGVAFSGSDYTNISFIEGSGGAADITADPQIAAGSVVGQKLTLIGRSNVNTVTLEHGTGLSLNGTAVLQEDSALVLLWDGTNWTEVSRR